MDSIVVVGGGGHAKVVIGVLRRLSWDVLGYTDAVDRGAVCGAVHLGDDAMLPEILSTHARCAAVIGVGKVDASPLRILLQKKVEAMGFFVPVVVSPTALVNEEVTLGSGTAVLDGAIVNSGTECGRGCIVNTNSTVEHDCRLGGNVHVASGATVCGGATVGNDCLVGAGATVIQGVRICDGCLIGAGAVVTRDLETPGVYVGVPAERVA